MTFWTICPKMHLEVMDMPDYKALYFKLFRATEQAIGLLIAAQRDCEELYLASSEPELRLITPAEVKKGAKEDFSRPKPGH